MARYHIESECVKDALLKCQILNPIVVNKMLTFFKNRKPFKVSEEFFLKTQGRIEYCVESSGAVQIHATTEDGRNFFRVQLNGDLLFLEGIDFVDFFGYLPSESSCRPSIEDFC